MEITTPRVRLEPWSQDDFGLLRAINAPELMTHLGGPEPEDRLLVRQRRYVALSADPPGRGRMLRIVVEPGGEPAGSVGFWETTWQGQQVYETGWTVLSAFQGRGIASAATAGVVERARAQREHRYLLAYPSVDNGASNAVCRKAGFEFLGESETEFPAGRMMRCNEWRLDLIPE